ncbi:MAG: carbohydrate kinase family protein [Solirubrobacteraceae bacterium]
MTARYWVVGPIASDSVLQVPELPPRGGFTQATAVVCRPGGAGANVAVGLASAGVPVLMVGYVGRDTAGHDLLASLRTAGVDTRHVRTVAGPTSQVLILVEPSGERTMVGLSPDELAAVPVPVEPVEPGDVVYLAGWRRSFAPQLRRFLDHGITVVSVPADDGGDLPAATYVVGSQHQLAGADPASDGRYQQALDGPTVAVVVTRGRRGARIHRRDGYVDKPALPVSAVDATGAGDAFAAGFLLRIGEGASVEGAVDTGTAWAASAVATVGSQPPPWSTVEESLR